MKHVMGRISARFREGCIQIHTGVGSFIHEKSSLILAIIGVLLLTGGLTELAHAQASNSFTEAEYDPTWVRFAVGQLFQLIEGPFGALIMVVSGLGAIVAAAMGAYKAAVGMLVVAVGAFVLRSLVSLFFGSNFDAYTDPIN